jgi:hypothetical protein
MAKHSCVGCRLFQYNPPALRARRRAASWFAAAFGLEGWRMLGVSFLNRMSSF